MPILSFNLNMAGQEGVAAPIITIDTNDTQAEVLATGYLNGLQRQTGQLSESMIAKVTTKTTPSATSTDVGWYEVSRSGDNWSLSVTDSPGNVVLPTTAGRIATYTDTVGTLSQNAATAVNGGSIQALGNVLAGQSGTAGYVASFSSTAARGYLALQAVANSGDFATTIANAAMGQTTTVTIPNPSNAAGRFLIGAGAAPFVSGNFPVASGTGGLMVDSGLAAANIQNKTNIIANSTANIGGAGAGPISVVVAGLTAASKIVATIASSTNTVAVGKCIATATGFDITFTADPGASCVVNYVAFVAAQ